MRWGENIVKVSLQLNLQKMPGRGSMQGFSCPLEERKRGGGERERKLTVTLPIVTVQAFNTERLKNIIVTKPLSVLLFLFTENHFSAF